MSKSLLQSEKVCFLTGQMRNLDKHHIMNGPNRTASDEDGLWIWLEHDAHMFVHAHPKLAIKLKKQGQEAWEKKRIAEGYTADEARSAWMKRYRKNYL